MLRAFGRMTSKMRGMASDFRRQFDEALREADLDDVRKTISDAQSLNPTAALRDAMNPLRQLGNEIKSDLQKATTPDRPPASATPEPLVEPVHTDAVGETAAKATEKVAAAAVSSASRQMDRAPTCRRRANRNLRPSPERSRRSQALPSRRRPRAKRRRRSRRRARRRAKRRLRTSRRRARLRARKVMHEPRYRGPAAAAYRASDRTAHAVDVGGGRILRGVPRLLLFCQAAVQPPCSAVQVGRELGRAQPPQRRAHLHGAAGVFFTQIKVAMFVRW